MIDYLESNFTDCKDLNGDGVYTMQFSNMINIEVDIISKKVFVVDIQNEEYLICESLKSIQQVKNIVKKHC